jgi:hypothetical protein
VVIVQRKSNLLQIIAALHPIGRFANLLDGGEKETNQDRDDGDHDEEFNQGEPASAQRRTTRLHKTPPERKE